MLTYIGPESTIDNDTNLAFKNKTLTISIIRINFTSTKKEHVISIMTKNIDKKEAINYFDSEN